MPFSLHNSNKFNLDDQHIDQIKTFTQFALNLLWFLNAENQAV